MKIFFLIFLILFAFAIEQDYVIGPHGISVHKSCVHHVTSGSHVRTLDDGSIIVEYKGDIKPIPKCEYPYKFIRNNKREKGVGADFYGWQVWATYEEPNQKSFDVFTDIMTIPSNPPGFEDGIIYLFPGLQNYDWIPTDNGPDPPDDFDIIQPVLQYGETPAGGGNYWAVASWYVTVYSGYLVADLLPVSPGNKIICNMTHLGQGSEKWFIGATVESTGRTSNLEVSKPRLVSQSWAYIALETYYLDGCDSYPQTPITFTSNKLFAENKNLTPNWVAHAQHNPTNCGEKANIQSPDSVSISF
eukprot:Anaeramoba_ignava/c21806_g2_i6.p1 GENE.c21806_g2_i6~~c21806_g2_i6.p1  ORF type:complete len:302 (+),score=84.10 c21806_g2_i6:19-924(+)